MRIDSYNQIAALYKSTKPSKAKSTAEITSARDQVQISRAGEIIRSQNRQSQQLRISGRIEWQSLNQA